MEDKRNERIKQLLEEAAERANGIPTLDEFFLVNDNVMNSHEMADQYLKNHVLPLQLNFDNAAVERYRKAYIAGYKDAVECLKVMHEVHK